MGNICNSKEDQNSDDHHYNQPINNQNNNADVEERRRKILEASEQRHQIYHQKYVSDSGIAEQQFQDNKKSYKLFQQQEQNNQKQHEPKENYNDLQQTKNFDADERRRKMLEAAEKRNYKN